MSVQLEIKNLHVSLEDTEILNGVDLTVRQGEIHALMGPNGTGKSTLAKVLMGHPAYTVTDGFVRLDGQDILEMDTDERARAGLYLAFQYPVAIPGVTVANFLRTAMNAHRRERNPDDPGISVADFRKALLEKMDLLDMAPEFAGRYLNDGFSGGEKKRAEVLQMAMLEPLIAIMDETDSGLDIDALKIVSSGVNRLSGPELGILLITHYQRILNYIQPDHVHIMMDGKIVRSGGAELAEQLEKEGYATIRETLEAGS